MRNVVLVCLGSLPVLIVALSMLQAIVKSRDPLLRDSSNPARHLLWPVWSRQVRFGMLWGMIAYLVALILVAAVVQ